MLSIAARDSSQHISRCRSQEADFNTQRQLLLDTSYRLDVFEQHEEVLARASGVPLEEVAPPVSLYQSAENILGPPAPNSRDNIMLEMMRPRLLRAFNDDSLLSLARQVPLPDDARSQASVETWRMRPRNGQAQTWNSTTEFT